MTITTSIDVEMTNTKSERDRARSALLLYDGKDAQPLRTLAAAYEPTDDAVRLFLRLAKDTDTIVEQGSTWLVKNLTERRDAPLPRDIGATVVARLASVDNSFSRLHLLQTLPMATLGSRSIAYLKDLLPELVSTETNGLTRAWVFNGFAEVAKRDHGYRDHATALLSEAYQMERAAVRARIRNALDGL